MGKMKRVGDKGMEKSMEQICEKEKDNRLMISLLAHIVEFRNGESATHIFHVQAITEMLLFRLLHKTDRYLLTASEVHRIVTASAMHDIGKISIPDKVLNKPGPLTEEEFDMMKRHTEIGAGILRDLSQQYSDELLDTAFRICRWHHERYDGGGYPDGLRGEEIPIDAQVVSLADVYDALVSERCYKKPFSHEDAMAMILGGQCGAFNPLLLECLKEISGELKRMVCGA